MHHLNHAILISYRHYFYLICYAALKMSQRTLQHRSMNSAIQTLTTSNLQSKVFYLLHCSLIFLNLVESPRSAKKTAGKLEDIDTPSATKSSAMALHYCTE